MALRRAGRAFSSGLACVRGCPGGATGLRIASNTDRALDFFDRFRLAFAAMMLSLVDWQMLFRRVQFCQLSFR
ncbi:MAG: hypothetical protein WCB68_13505 [Pyrinomonadaceae bacterium]